MDRIRFFEEWSPEAAWVYGLVLGDGHVMCGAKGGRIYFVGNEDTVCKFAALLAIPADRLVFKRGVWHAWCDDKPLALWFRQRGINAKKTGSLPWPKDVPARVKPDFARGLADSDGSFSFEDKKKLGRRGRINFRFGFGSATQSFTEAFARYAKTERAIVHGTKQMPSGTKHYYSFHMGMEESLRFLRRIYGDAPFHTRNEERYQKYLRAEALWADYNKGCQHVGPRGGLCGKPIHSGELCTEHMWAEKKEGRVCEGCGDAAKPVIGSFCNACKYRSLRLMKNPNLKTRARR